METLKIISKRQAEAFMVDSLFKAGGTFTNHDKSKFDLGKYKSSLIGYEVPKHMVDKVHIVWSERRQDANGPYYQLYCFSKRETVTA